MTIIQAPSPTTAQWFIVRGWLDTQEWGDEPPDPDDVWVVGDRVQIKGSTIEGTILLNDNQPFLGGYLPYLLVQWDHPKPWTTLIEPELLIRLTRFIPPGLTWKAEESFSDTEEFLEEKISSRNDEHQQQFLEEKISSRNDEHQQQFLEEKSRKTRRCKGEGSGCIYWRTVTKKGKEYQEAYYQYEFWENGDRLVKTTKYLTKRLLPQVQQLEQQKAPVQQILKLLGVKNS